MVFPPMSPGVGRCCAEHFRVVDLVVMVERFVSEDFVVLACPVADGFPPCCRGCGGGWPGTKATTRNLTEAVVKERLDPNKLGCQPLVDRARAGINELKRASLVSKSR